MKKYLTHAHQKSLKDIHNNFIFKKMKISQVSIKQRKQSVVYLFNGIYCTVKENEQLDKHSSIVNLINIMLSESETPTCMILLHTIQAR